MRIVLFRECNITLQQCHTICHPSHPSAEVLDIQCELKYFNTCLIRQQNSKISHFLILSYLFSFIKLNIIKFK